MVLCDLDSLADVLSLWSLGGWLGEVVRGGFGAWLRELTEGYREDVVYSRGARFFAEQSDGRWYLGTVWACVSHGYV